MRRFKQWVVELLKRLGRWTYTNVIDRKITFYIIGLATGLSVMFIKMEAPRYYQWASEGQRYTEEFLNRSVGEVAKAGSFADSEKLESSPLKEQDLGDTTPSISLIADYIHFKESTNGTARVGLHVTCKARGLSNEYGYNPPKCYDNNNQVRLIVEDWIIRHLKEMSVDELLLHYSNGAYTYEKIN